MRLPRAVVPVAVALAMPASAAAATIQDDLDAAHAHWGSQICAGQWQVVPDTTLASRGHWGEATGLAYTWNQPAGAYTDDHGNRWDWHVARCEFSMDPTLEHELRRCVVRHEVGHFIYGPGHDGPMRQAAIGECVAALTTHQRAAAPKVAAAAHVSPTTRRRCRAQRLRWTSFNGRTIRRLCRAASA